MSLKEQEKVLDLSGRRKIIVSTNIAETSLTLPGVRAVFDSGQCKLLRRDIASGANQLKRNGYPNTVPTKEQDVQENRHGRDLPTVE